MMKFSRYLVALGLLAFVGAVNAQSYNRFQPANGVLVGDTSTYVTTAATSSNIRSLWTGTCNATTFLRGDGQCIAVSSPVGANPTASVGLTAVNGSANTFMRSDGAPALSQAISPTWTGSHVFTNSVTYSKAGNAAFTTERTDAPTDAKRWRWQVTSTGQWGLVTETDAGVATNSAVSVARTGTTVDSIGLNATALTWNGSAMVNVGSAPTWAGTHTFGSSTLGLVVSSSNPLSRMTNTSAGTDAKTWDQSINSSGTWQLFTRFDSGSLGTIALSISRSATAPTGVTSAVTVTAPAFNANNPAGASLYRWIDTTAPAGEQIYDVVASSGNLSFRTRTDADAAGNTWAQISRTGTTVDAVSLAATSVQVNGSEVCRADGTGCPASGGGTPANPTASVGLSAVNGVATTYMRSDAAPALSQSIAPTWTGAHTFQNNANATTGTTAQWGWRATGGAANVGNWLMRASNSGTFTLSSATDAAPTSAVNDVFSVTRSSGTTLGGITFPTFADFTMNSGSTLTSGLRTNFLTFNDAGAAANNKFWNFGPVLETFSGTVCNDAGSSCGTWISVDRTGAVVDSVTFPAGAGFVSITRDGSNAFRVGNPDSGSMTAFQGSAFLYGTSRASIHQNASINTSTIIAWNATTTGDAQFVGFVTENVGTARGGISYNRTSNVVAYNTTSDARLKANILDADPAGSLIDAIRVRSFDWKETGHGHVPYGFIAQELFEVAPGAVTKGDDNGGDTPTQAWQVDNSKLVPMLVKEIQDLRKRVAELESVH